MTEAILHGNGRELANLKKQTIPFYLQDKSGKMLIKPEGCEVNDIFPDATISPTGHYPEPLSGLKLLADAFQFNTTQKGNRERVTESMIATGSSLNVFGIATLEGEQKFLQ